LKKLILCSKMQMFFGIYSDSTRLWRQNGVRNR
jgi:hypothetical protein